MTARIREAFTLKSGSMLMAFALGLAGLTQPVNAGLIVENLLADGDGLITRDTDTGLEWLDLDQTIGLSVNQIRDGAGGWSDLGFSHANMGQVGTFFQNAGIPNILQQFSSTDNAREGFSANNFAPVTNLLSKIGTTNTNPALANIPLAQGWAGIGEADPGEVFVPFVQRDVVTNDGRAILFNCCANEGSTDPDVGNWLVHNAPIVAPNQVIFLDWENNISEKFSVQTLDVGTDNERETVVNMKGVIDEPTVNVDPNFMESVLLKVQNIFSNSFAADGGGGPAIIPIVDSHDGSLDNVLSVRFSPELYLYDKDGDPSTDKIRLVGRAFDVAREEIIELKNVDQFNKRKNGEVAVFVLPGESEQVVAERIAHEVGHGLGLFHVDSSETIMTPNLGNITNPEFSAQVENFDRLGPQTHNAIFHLRRYTLEEDPSSLEDKNIEFGSWNFIDVRQLKLNFELLNSSVPLVDLFALTDSGAGNSTEGGDDEEVVIHLGDLSDLLLPNFEIIASRGQNLQIVASSSLEGLSDIVFGFGDPDNPILSIEELLVGSFSGSIFQYLSDSDTYRVVGNFTLTAASVVEPSSLVLFGFGLVGLGVMRQRRKK